MEGKRKLKQELQNKDKWIKYELNIRFHWISLTWMNHFGCLNIVTQVSSFMGWICMRSDFKIHDFGSNSQKLNQLNLWIGWNDSWESSSTRMWNSSFPESSRSSDRSNSFNLDLRTIQRISLLLISHFLFTWMCLQVKKSAACTTWCFSLLKPVRFSRIHRETIGKRCWGSVERAIRGDPSESQ